MTRSSEGHMWPNRDPGIVFWEEGPGMVPGVQPSGETALHLSKPAAHMLRIKLHSYFFVEKLLQTQY